MCMRYKVHGGKCPQAEVCSCALRGLLALSLFGILLVAIICAGADKLVQEMDAPKARPWTPSLSVGLREAILKGR